MKKLLIIPLLFAFYVGMAQFNSSSIIGKPIRVDNLLVAQKDFPDNMNWDDAKKACTELGNGWRLPNLLELRTLFENKKKIGGFDYYYWSSEEHDNNYALVSGGGGNVNGLPKTFTHKVRAVKSF
jgi:hypothetical protein